MEALEMERPMDNWNDKRLDELSRRVDSGFTKVDRRFERIEGEMKAGFAKVDRRFERIEGEMNAGFAKTATKDELGEVKTELKSETGELMGEFRQLNKRFDRLLHTLMIAGVGFGVTMFGTVAGFIVTQA